MAEGRTLVNFQPLPPRAGVLDRAQADADIREACAKAEAKLTEMSRRYGITGWVIADDGWEFGVVSHTVVGKLRLVRP